MKRKSLALLAALVVVAVGFFLMVASESPQITLRFVGYETNGAARFVISNGMASTYTCWQLEIERPDGNWITPEEKTLTPGQTATLVSRIALTNVTFRARTSCDRAKTFSDHIHDILDRVGIDVLDSDSVIRTETGLVHPPPPPR